MKKIICAALCFIVCLGVLASCGSGSGPESVVEKMQKAIDEGDGNALLACFEPSVQELYKAFLGDNLDSLLEEYQSEDGKKITMTVDKVEYTSDDKTAATLTVSTTDGEETHTEEMPVKLVDGNWYLDLSGALGGSDD